MEQSGHQLLVVEDDQHLASTLIIYYRKEGFVVDHVSSGKAAINFIIQHNPQMVICKDQLADLSYDEIHQVVRPYFTGKIILNNSHTEADLSCFEYNQFHREPSESHVYKT